MSKAGLPTGVKMRHDSHYVDQLTSHSRSIGRTIAIEAIYPNPEQPRREFGDLSELTASIREKGVLEPLLVKPDNEGRYMIIAGERRWRSSQLAGLKEVPCIEMELDEQGIAEIALIENLQRKDLNIWEESDGLAALISRFGYTQEEVAKKISKSRSTVSELMTVSGLPENIRNRCKEANISSKSTLLEIARQFDDAAMEQFLDELTQGAKKTRSKQEKPRTQVRKVSESPRKTFHFECKEPHFSLQLNFGEREKFSRGEVLKALKLAFDAVKNEDVRV